MPDSLDLERALVIGVASSALFDLSESDAVFRNEGEEKYRAYQRENLDEILEPGVAFPFIRRLLDLNDLSEDERLVEVVILSRNDPETGMRVMRSVQRHGLDITRAIFMQGARRTSLWGRCTCPCSSRPTRMMSEKPCPWGLRPDTSLAQE